MVDRDSVAPRIALLLPPAVLLHVVEEWFGGFPAWTVAVLGDGVSPERFLAVNAVGLVLFTVGTLAALRYSGAAWLVVSFAALFIVNAVLHTLATLGWGLYSPGLITGLLVYIPLGIVVLRKSASRLPKPVFVRAILFGVLFHAVATATALS
jgi:hypothetical protein